jgi:hypothetical protein
MEAAAGEDARGGREHLLTDLLAGTSPHSLAV